MQSEITIKISFAGAENTGKVVIGDQKEVDVKNGSEKQDNLKFEVPNVPQISSNEGYFGGELSYPHEVNLGGVSVPSSSSSVEAIPVPTAEGVFSGLGTSSQGFVNPPQVEDISLLPTSVGDYDFTPPEVPTTESRLINFEFPDVPSGLLTQELVESHLEPVLYPNGNDGYNIPPLPEN